VIEHDMPLLSSLCDRLVALEQGAVLVTGAPDDVLTDDRVVRSYLGGDPTAVARSGALGEAVADAVTAAAAKPAAAARRKGRSRAKVGAS
jgi:ABC-type hemin transport system ATPase subunit